MGRAWRAPRGWRAAVGGWRTAQIYAATHLLQRLRHDLTIQRALRTLYFQHRIKRTTLLNMTRLPLTGSTSAIWLRLRGNWSHSRLWQILSRN